MDPDSHRPDPGECPRCGYLGWAPSTALTEPITTYVQPVAWTEDNSAVIFTSPEQDGTWKVTLSDGTLDKVAEVTYVGEVAS